MIRLLRRRFGDGGCAATTIERASCFLNTIEAEVPAGKAVHGILDNYAAHKHPNVRRWAQPPRPLHIPLSRLAGY